MTLAMCMQTSKRLEKGIATMGQISRTKAIVSKLTRESVALARETMGGNGMLVSNQVVKFLSDVEAPYTFEGTYDINMLISGAEITGKQAFV